MWTSCLMRFPPLPFDNSFKQEHIASIAPTVYSTVFLFIFFFWGGGVGLFIFLLQFFCPLPPHTPPLTTKVIFTPKCYMCGDNEKRGEEGEKFHLKIHSPIQELWGKHRKQIKTEGPCNGNLPLTIFKSVISSCPTTSALFSKPSFAEPPLQSVIPVHFFVLLFSPSISG